MRFATIKRASEIKLEGIKVVLDVVNNSNKGLLLTDAKGNALRVRLESYNLSIEVLAPPETEKKHKLTGSVLGLPVDKTFDDAYEAQREQSKLEEAGAGTANLTVQEVQVLVDGEIAHSDDIPF